MSSGTLYVNKKWRNTPLYDILSKIQFRVLIDNNLDQLDFKTNGIGFCYLKSLDIGECRRTLAKVHNIHQSLRLQAFIDMSQQKPDFLYKIQEFAVIDLKIQIIPVDNPIDLTQYLERLMFIETLNESNPFIKPAQINNGHSEYLSCLKQIPKVGDKSAQQLAKKFLNLRAIANASLDDLISCIGANSAKSVYNYFHQKS